MFIAEERLSDGSVNNLEAPVLRFRESLPGHVTTNSRNAHSSVLSLSGRGKRPAGCSHAVGFPGLYTPQVSLEENERTHEDLQHGGDC